MVGGEAASLPPMSLSRPLPHPIEKREMGKSPLLGVWGEEMGWLRVRSRGLQVTLPACDGFLPNQTLHCQALLLCDSVSLTASAREVQSVVS